MRITTSSAPEAPSSVRAKTLPRTLRSDVREKGAVRAALAFDRVLDASATSGRAIARALDVDESLVRAFKGGAKKLYLGDLYALPRSVALELLDAIRAELADEAPRARLSPAEAGCTIARESGQAVGALLELARAPDDPEVRRRALRELREAREAEDAAIRELDGGTR